MSIWYNNNIIAFFTAGFRFKTSLDETYLPFGILARRKNQYLHVRTRPLRRKFRGDPKNGPKKFRAVVERSRFWRVRIKFNIPPALRKNNPKFIDETLRSGIRLDI